MEVPEPPRKKFEFEYNGEIYVVLTDDITKEYSYSNYFIDDFIEYGKVRKTEKTAEQALRLQTRTMRLHALAEQLGGLKEFKLGEENWYVYLDAGCDVWMRDSLMFTNIPTVVYMTKECAEKICEFLNNGEFDLEVENERD